RLVDGGERLAARARGLHVGGEHARHLLEVRHEAVDLDRPHIVARLCGDLVQDERPVVEDAAELLEQHCSVEEVEILRLEDPDPAELGELGHRRRRIRLEERARLAAQVFLFRTEREIHHRLLGSPSTRSATMLRRISLVPASIVLPRERSCWYCQYPSAYPPPSVSCACEPRISSASLVRRWLFSDQTSF